MQPTLQATRRTPHGALRLVQAMSAWLVKTRHAPSRRSRDARVYGYTTTAMHDIEYTPSPHTTMAMHDNKYPPPPSASKAVFSINKMQLPLYATRQTPHGASRLVQEMSV